MKPSAVKTLIAVPVLLAAGFAAWIVLRPADASSGPVTLAVEVFDRDTPGLSVESGMQARWIRGEVKKKLGYDVTFVPVSRGQEVDAMNSLMAAGQAPDISFVYDAAVVASYIEQDALTDLTRLLDRNAPDLVKYMGPDHLGQGNWDGKQWTVPAKRTITACFSAFVRKDWLDALGMAVPRNNAEFFTMLKAFKEKDPGRTGGKVVPWAMALDSNNIDWQFSMLVNSYVTKMTTEERYCLERWVVPGYKEGVRTLNYMYNQGLISPDFGLDTDATLEQRDVVKGLVGSFQNNYDQPYRMGASWMVALRKNVPGAMYIPFDPFLNWENKHWKFKYTSAGFHIFVPRTSRNAAPALRYLNWMSDPANIFFLQNGKKGVQYLEERNGIPTDIVGNDKLPAAEKFNAVDYAIIVNGKEFGDDDRNAEAASFAYPGYEELYKQAYKIAYTDARMPPHFDTVIESEAKYRQTLNGKQAELLVRSVTCKPSEFDAVYDALVKEYMDGGGAAIQEEKKAAFKKMQASQGIK